MLFVDDSADKTLVDWENPHSAVAFPIILGESREPVRTLNQVWDTCCKVGKGTNHAQPAGMEEASLWLLKALPSWARTVEQP